MSRSALWRQEGAKKMREKEAEDLFSMAVEGGRVSYDMYYRLNIDRTELVVFVLASFQYLRISTFILCRFLELLVIEFFFTEQSFKDVASLGTRRLLPFQPSSVGKNNQISLLSKVLQGNNRLEQTC